MTNPFENNDADYYVLTNDEGQHSLWPSFIEIPAGWNNVYGAENRQSCLDYIEANWTDMRPNSLVKIMENAGR